MDNFAKLIQFESEPVPANPQTMGSINEVVLTTFRLDTIVQMAMR